jgi:hypothetical protein
LAQFGAKWRIFGVTSSVQFFFGVISGVISGVFPRTGGRSPTVLQSYRGD